MSELSYVFNPLDFGFEPLSAFPELDEFLSRNAYVKVTEIGKGCYWYISCSQKIMRGDDRWLFTSNAFSQDMNYEFPHQIYLGTISNEKYAETLLCHLLGTMKNSDVEIEGQKRLRRNINHLRLISPD